MLIGPDELTRLASNAILLGRPFESLADWAARTIAAEAAAKVVSFAEMREKLRPLTTAATTETTPH
jgi:hypothetical protein